MVPSDSFVEYIFVTTLESSSVQRSGQREKYTRFAFFATWYSVPLPVYVAIEDGVVENVEFVDRILSPMKTNPCVAVGEDGLTREFIARIATHASGAARLVDMVPL